MMIPLKRIFSVLAITALMLLSLPACNNDEDIPATTASRVKVRLLNKDCMGTVLAILDPLYISWGQAGYNDHSGQTYNGAVWVQKGETLFADLEVGQEYYADIQSVDKKSMAYCKRMPGPPNKAVAIFRIY